MDVYEYATPITSKGFVFMDIRDMTASVTGMIAGGPIYAFQLVEVQFMAATNTCLKLATNFDV